MSYQNIARPIMQYLSYFKSPRVLEIGIDKGQTTIPLCHNLSMFGRPWLYEGVDIKLNQSVFDTISSMSGINCFNIEPDLPVHSHVIIHEVNSLVFLKEAVKNNIKYNLILIDGDHNYYTVQKELELAKEFALPSTIIVCDDYNSKWAYQDMFYEEHEGYEENQLVTKRQESAKAGVRPAVDDFIEKSEGKWGLVVGLGMRSDYCILYQKENVLDMRFYKPNNTTSVNLGTLEIYFNKKNCPEVNENLMRYLDYTYQRHGSRQKESGNG